MILHRFAWAAGWLASSTGAGVSTTLNAEDAYVHIGIKSGGVALDGEGKYGSNVPDPTKPWAEKAITLDAYGYHGMTVLDNGTGTVQGGFPAPVSQKDSFDVVGATVRAQNDSLVLDAGGQYEWHSHPYQGSAAITSPSGAVIPGVPDYTSAQALVAWGELDYVVWPWFVPGVRAEYSVGSAELHLAVQHAPRDSRHRDARAAEHPRHRHRRSRVRERRSAGRVMGAGRWRDRLANDRDQVPGGDRHGDRRRGLLARG